MSDQNDMEAYVLSQVYGFCPPLPVYPARIRNVNYGKYEPDHFPEAEQRCMILAHFLGATNILIKYNPQLNLYLPYFLTGNVSPDCKGNYAAESAYNEKNSFVREDRQWFIWYWGLYRVKPDVPLYTYLWVISQSIGDMSGPHWWGAHGEVIPGEIDEGTTPTGYYFPRTGATGSAFVLNMIYTPYRVSGTLTPDSTGIYQYGGNYNNLPYYKRDDNAYFIWWNGFWWVISAELGNDIIESWSGEPWHDITGKYDPQYGATGTAIVSIA